MAIIKRGLVHCFRDEYSLAVKDSAFALKESRAVRKARQTHDASFRTSVLNGSGRPSLAPGRPRPDPEGQVKYGSGQRGPAVGQAGGRERWRFFRPPLTWADLGPTLDPEIRKRVVNLQKITLKSFISWGRVKFCVEL